MKYFNKLSLASSAYFFIIAQSNIDASVRIVCFLTISNVIGLCGVDCVTSHIT